MHTYQFDVAAEVFIQPDPGPKPLTHLLSHEASSAVDDHEAAGRGGCPLNPKPTSHSIASQPSRFSLKAVASLELRAPPNTQTPKRA